MGSFGAFFVNSPLFRLPESLHLDASVRLLDAGCGRGALMRMLDERVHFRQPPAGFDPSAVALRLASRDERRSARSSHLARAAPTELPFVDRAFDLVISGHAARYLDDEELLVFLFEIWRVLGGGGLALLWEFAPSGNPRLDAWNRRVLSADAARPRLRSTTALLQLAELAGFEFFRDARLRPFLFPPIPRASILIGRPPGNGDGAQR